MGHIVVLRLLVDTAKRERHKSLVTFGDFWYITEHHGESCLIFSKVGLWGQLMAIIAMYKVQQSVLGTALGTSTIEVRQNSLTSCVLFIVNDLIKTAEENCEDDGFLSCLHILVPVDYTVLLTTLRDRIIRKVQLLKRFCDMYGMKVNEKKTKFFATNGCENDNIDLSAEGITIG